MHNPEQQFNAMLSVTGSDQKPCPMFLLKEHEVAKLIQRPVATLRRERWARKGIRFVKIGRAVRYRWSDIEEYIEANVICTSAGVRK